MNIIDSWDKLTISKWQEAISLIGIRIDGFEGSIELLKTLSDLSTEQIHALTLVEFNSYLSKLNFLNTECNTKVVDNFTIDGVKYLVNWKVETKTAGQFIDLTTLTKDPELINQNLHYIMAVICLPKGEKYSSETFEDRANIFKDKLTMDIVFPLSVFFYKVLNDSLPNIVNSLNEEVMKMKEKLESEMNKSDLVNTGDGM